MRRSANKSICSPIFDPYSQGVAASQQQARPNANLCDDEDLGGAVVAVIKSFALGMPDGRFQGVRVVGRAVLRVEVEHPFFVPGTRERKGRRGREGKEWTVELRVEMLPSNRNHGSHACRGESEVPRVRAPLSRCDELGYARFKIRRLPTESECLVTTSCIYSEHDTASDVSALAGAGRVFAKKQIAWPTCTFAPPLLPPPPRSFEADTNTDNHNKE